jgi:hypothetical protein
MDTIRKFVKLVDVIMLDILYFNPNPHFFIAITKATACGSKQPLLPNPLHSAQPCWRGRGKGGCYLYTLQPLKFA